MEKNIIKDQDLEAVSGGTKEEINNIIAAFRKYGFENEAKKLEKSGVYFFKDGFDTVMKAVSDGTFNLAQYITKEIPFELEQIQAAYEELHDPTNNQMKIMIQIGDGKTK